MATFRETERDIQILNDFRLRRGRVSKRTGKRSTKRRLSVEIKADLIAVDTSARTIARPASEAVAKLIRQDLERGGGQVSDRTLRQRGANVRAFARGAPWARKRWAGARTGETPPSTSLTWGHDSGRLAQGVTTRFNKGDDSWTTNVPANRLSPAVHRSTEDYKAFLAEFKRRIPALGSSKVVKRPEFRKALAAGLDDAITLLKDANADKRRRLRALRLRAARSGIQILKF